MKLKRRSFLIGGMAILATTLIIPLQASAAKRIVFGGGPAGGTFQVVANAIQVYDPVKASKDYRVKAQSSAGSVENLRKVNQGKMQFGVVYSGHVYLGRQGKLKKDTRKYEDVMAVSYLYGAPAQLVVHKGSGIKSTKDLVGKKVGVGNAGSGAFANCELFFTHMGVWDKIERNAMGYNDAAAAFGNNQLDAFWLFTAFPSGAVIMAAQTNDIELVDLGRTRKRLVSIKHIPTYQSCRCRRTPTRAWTPRPLRSRTLPCGSPIPRCRLTWSTTCCPRSTPTRVWRTCGSRKRPLRK